MHGLPLALSALLLTGSAAPLFAEAASPAIAEPSVKPQLGAWGVDLAAMDKSVKVGDDFWRHVNGAWDKNTQIAADRTSAGVFDLLADQAETQVRIIVEDLGRDPSKTGRLGQQLGDFYSSWMNEAEIETNGTKAIGPYLDRVASVKSRADLLKLFATPGYVSPISFHIMPDPDDPTRYIAAAGQSGLGMPNRDFYLLEGTTYETTRAAYRNYVVTMHQLAGLKDAEAKADRIITLETALAKAHWDRARQRDIKQNYNPMNRTELTKLAPQFEWTSFLQEFGLGQISTIIAGELSAITETGKLLDTVPLSTWKEYSAFHFLRSNAIFLPKAFDDGHFNFYSKALRGIPEQRERWKRGIQLINDSMGEAVGRVYVERHYPAESNRQMNELIVNLRAGLEARLKASTWMDDATKEQARAKLAAFDPRVGYPTTWTDYDALKISRGDLLGNAQRAGKFAWDLQLLRLGKPVDRALWELTPQVVNAYYNPLMNQITFPAAILQPPYFDPAADPAVNYGAIGAIIGHEIGHGFDDRGRQFDATGRIRDWWTVKSSEQFNLRAEKLGNQFGKYEPVPGMKINSKLTMGENIGDLGGLEMAYAAYRLHVAKHGEPPVLDGLSGDQRFFIAYGQAWREKVRQDALREQLISKPHSPVEYRVNGIVRNMDAWYKAFGVKPGDKMYLPPEERVSFW